MARLLLAAALAASAAANIIFSHVQPTCDFTRGRGCLRGQACLLDNTCVDARVLSRQADVTNSTAPRSDGRCGSAFHGATRDPNGEYGGCCSALGWCGKKPQHCLPSEGCQSGCDPAPSLASTSTLTAAQSEPVLGSPTASGMTSATGVITTDGTCGANNGGAVCGSWHLGSCCSMYGFCGTSSAHCGDGCQSGPCAETPVAPAPGPSPAPENPNPGSFKVVGDSGVPAMHAALTPNGRVVFLDKVENSTKLNVSDEHFAYSAEYDPATNQRVPLAYKTNAFCAGGSFLANGTLMSIGGNGPLNDTDDSIFNGFQSLRWLTRSEPSQDGEGWSEIIEPKYQLDIPRWYASAQTMPDGTIFVASGSLNGLDPSKLSNNNPTYEILDINGVSQGESIPMEILIKAQPYYMYPFLHLLKDGNVFVFVSKSSEIFDVANNKTIKKFDDLPGDFRTYPCTGGSVLLPLSSAKDWDPEIIICGGCAYQDITSPTDAYAVGSRL